MIIPSNISRRKDPKNLLLYFYSHDSAVAADFAAIPSPLQEHLELRTPSLCLSLQPLHTHTHSLSRNNFKKLRRFRDKCSWWAFGALCINQTFWFILFLFSLIAILFFKHLRSQRILCFSPSIHQSPLSNVDTSGPLTEKGTHTFSKSTVASRSFSFSRLYITYIELEFLFNEEFTNSGFF